MNDDSEHKKPKRTKKCTIKKETKFNDYKNCQFNNEIILKGKQIFKNKAVNVYTEEMNKIALSSNDDKRLQTFDKITTDPCGTNACKACETGMLSKYK